MKRAIIVGAVGAAAAGLVACSCNRQDGGTEPGSGSGDGGGVPPAQVSAPREAGGEEAPVQGTYTGVLHGGMMAIGGETTGWMLQGPGEGKGAGMDVDVSKVREEAQRLQGQRVVIRGRVVEKRYVERGAVKVLVAEEIAAAK